MVSLFIVSSFLVSLFLVSAYIGDVGLLLALLYDAYTQQELPQNR